MFDSMRGRLSTGRYPPDSWPSVVVLMAQPSFPSEQEIVSRAKQAWGKAGAPSVAGTLRDGASLLIQCGPLSYSVYCSHERHGKSGRQPMEILQRPWDDHTCWMGVDLPNLRNEALFRAGDLGMMYKTLLIFVFLAWNNNCPGVVFPGEGITVPNFGDLAASINWARRTGLNLAFLD